MGREGLGGTPVLIWVGQRAQGPGPALRSTGEINSTGRSHVNSQGMLASMRQLHAVCFCPSPSLDCEFQEVRPISTLS